MPKELIKLRLYGELDEFEEMLREGYTEIAFGGGDWVSGDWVSGGLVGHPFDMRASSQKISRLCVFYHPDGRIVTYQYYESVTPKVYTIKFKYQDIGAEYTEEGFQKFLQRFQIRLGAKVGLAELVETWREQSGK